MNRHATRRAAAAALGLSLITTSLMVAAVPAAAARLPKLSVSNASATEGSTGAVLKFVVKLNRKAKKKTTVNYVTKNGTAVAGKDFGATKGKLTFKRGQASKKVAVKVLPDVFDENNETMKLVISRPVNAKIADGTGVGTIKDDDGLPTVGLTGRDPNYGKYFVSEDEPSISIPVKVSPPSGKTVTVNYKTVGDVGDTSPGAADEDVDFEDVEGTLTFGSGVSQRNIVVPIIQDAVPEGTEYFELQLSQPVNATFGTDSDFVYIPDSCSDDGVEDDDAQVDATHLDAAELVSGRVSCPYDSDYFSFTAQKGQIVTANATYEGPNAEIGPAFVGQRGDWYATATAGGSRKTFAAPSAGTFYVYMRNQSSERKPYSISLSFLDPVACTEDALEPNNTSSSADLMADGFDLTDGQICSGDDDIFKFTTGSFDRNELRLDPEDSGQALIFYVETASGDVLQHSFGTVGNDLAIDFHTRTAGTYYLRVTGAEPGHQNGYRLTFDNIPEAPCVNDGYEPNNTTPSPLPMETPVNATICYDDRDVWSFAANAGDIVTVTYAQGAGSGSLTYKVADSSGTQLNPLETPDPSSLEFEVNTTGTYRVSVFGLQFWHANNYTLRVETGPVPACGSDPNEPNDDLFSPTVMSSGSSESGALCSGEVDFFSFDATEGHTVRFQVDSATPPTPKLFFGGFQPGGGHVTPSSSGDNFIQFVAPSTGTYIVGFMGYSRRDVFDYGLTITRTAP